MNIAGIYGPVLLAWLYGGNDSAQEAHHKSILGPNATVINGGANLEWLATSHMLPALTR